MRTTSDKYSTLDGLRGVAAMLVVMYHFPGFFRPVYVENSYLMVDLFFVMSGFVIASAYEEKLSCGDISPLRFMRLRLIRLYPLYALGTLLGTAGLLWRLPRSDWHLVTSALPLGLLMLPCPLVMRIFYPLSYAERVLYPLNYPSWSLFFELLANAGYAVFFKYLSTRVLLTLVAASGVMLIAKGIHGKPLSAGWILAGSYVGLLRIAYSFSTGILLFRFRAARRKTSNVLAIALVAAFILLFCLPIPDIFRTVFIFSIALFVSPVLVWVAAAVEPTRKVRKVFLFFGSGFLRRLRAACAGWRLFPAYVWRHRAPRTPRYTLGRRRLAADGGCSCQHCRENLRHPRSPAPSQGVDSAQKSSNDG
jgi:Predicted acyltransferases